MKDFDPKFGSFPDYIIGITKEIWEDRGLDKSLEAYYAPDIIVRSPSSIVVGNKDVMVATRATLDEFPDRQLLGEDVIWSGTPEDGMLSSHRIISTATHEGDGAYGKATGKKLRYRIIADCHAIGNQINDEWLIRDQGAIVRQLGVDPADYARGVIKSEGGHNKSPMPYLPENDIPGPYKGRGNDNDWGRRLADIVTRMMAGDMVEKEYDRAASLFYPGGVESLGFDGAAGFWGGLRQAFPDAGFTIHHTIGMDGDGLMPPRAALRWSLDGRHEGGGIFASPTGARVHIMGMTHAEFGAYGANGMKPDGGLRREFTLYDETAIWKQILLQTEGTK